jgi:hypothetical protein
MKGTNKQYIDKKGEPLTAGIVHAGISGLQRFVACKNSWCKLIGNRFVIPHGTIPAKRCMQG